MERKPDIQYVHQFYIYGSEAPAIELEQPQKKKRFSLPRVVPDRKIRLSIDPMAVCGIAVAIVMVILMAVSVNSYLEACAEYELMTEYVIGLQNTNVEKQQEYAKLYDLADIEEKALALGMIPIEDAETVTFRPVYPEPEAEESWWADISWFLKGLFA